MASLAGQSGAVVLGDDLGEAFGLGVIRLVATDAENGGIEFWRMDRDRIGGVGCEGAVAGFAVHACMLSRVLHSDDIGMASLAGLVSSKHDSLGGYFRDGVSTIVAIFTETPGYQHSPHEDKSDYRGHEDKGDTQQMLGILETIHCCTRP
jgi:hypothetical protein